METIRSKINNIVVIRIRPAGDTLLSTPIYRELRKKFPDSIISTIVETPFHELLINNPYIDKVYTYRRKSFFSYLKLLVSLLFMKFDLAIDLKNTSRSSTISLFTGARYRIGKNKPRNFFYSHRIANSAKNKYTVYSSLSFLSPLGIDSDDISLDLHLTTYEKQFGEKCWNELFPQKKIRFLVYISGKYPTQRWPKEHFAELIKKLAAIPHDVNILVVGGTKEHALCGEICRLSNCGAMPCPDTSLRELAAVISSASVMVTADTGPRHMATAFNVPTLTLFTSTSPEVWSPPDLDRNPVVFAKDVKCIPCQKRWCENMRCVNELAPGDVYKAALALINTITMETNKDD